MGERFENPLYDLGIEFRDELKAVVQKVLIERGVKKTSDLVDSVEWEYTREQLQMVVNDYYRYLSDGRKPQTRKIPIYALIQFIKKNRITSNKYSTTELAFALQTSIYKNGIRGKNFIDQVQKIVTDRVEIEVADKLEEQIAESLFLSFQVK